MAELEERAATRFRSNRTCGAYSGIGALRTKVERERPIGKRLLHFLVADFRGAARREAFCQCGAGAGKGAISSPRILLFLYVDTKSPSPVARTSTEPGPRGAVFARPSSTYHIEKGLIVEDAAFSTAFAAPKICLAARGTAASEFVTGPAYPAVATALCEPR